MLAAGFERRIHTTAPLLNHHTTTTPPPPPHHHHNANPGRAQHRHHNANPGRAQRLGMIAPIRAMRSAERASGHEFSLSSAVLLPGNRGRTAAGAKLAVYAQYVQLFAYYSEAQLPLPQRLPHTIQVIRYCASK